MCCPPSFLFLGGMRLTLVALIVVLTLNSVSCLFQIRSRIPVKRPVPTKKSESLRCRAKNVGNKLLTTLPTKKNLRRHWVRYGIPLLAAQIAATIIRFGWRKLLPSSPLPSPSPSSEIVESSDSNDVPNNASSQLTRVVPVPFDKFKPLTSTTLPLLKSEVRGVEELRTAGAK